MYYLGLKMVFLHTSGKRLEKFHLKIVRFNVTKKHFKRPVAASGDSIFVITLKLVVVPWIQNTIDIQKWDIKPNDTFLRKLYEKNSNIMFKFLTKIIKGSEQLVWGRGGMEKWSIYRGYLKVAVAVMKNPTPRPLLRICTAVPYLMTSEKGFPWIKKRAC